MAKDDRFEPHDPALSRPEPEIDVGSQPLPPLSAPPDISLPNTERDYVLVAVALVLPVVAGIMEMFVTSVPLAWAISLGTVLVTSLMVSIDFSYLDQFDQRGRKRDSAFLLFLAMCLLWIVVYPFAFFRRRHFVGPNLALPALGVAIFFLAGPFVYAYLTPPELPQCDSPEVKQVLEQIARGSPMGPQVTSIVNHRQLRYDKGADIREGECVINTIRQPIVVKFTVQWINRSKGLFEVRILP